MKEIKINVSVSGPNFTYEKGEIVVEDDLAMDLVAAGHATYVNPEEGDLKKVESIKRQRKAFREKVAKRYAVKSPNGKKAKKE